MVKPLYSTGVLAFSALSDEPPNRDFQNDMGASRLVARREQSGMPNKYTPDFAALHPGYGPSKCRSKNSIARGIASARAIGSVPASGTTPLGSRYAGSSWTGVFGASNP